MKGEIMKRQHTFTPAICTVCGKPYQARRDGFKKYCSPRCMGIGQQKRLSIKCEYCGRIIDIPESRYGRTRFCSMECSNTYKKGKSFSEETQFMKGHTSWNKSTKGMTKENSGSFKKGHIMPDCWKGLAGKAKKGKIYVPLDKQRERKVNYLLANKDKLNKYSREWARNHKSTRNEIARKYIERLPNPVVISNMTGRGKRYYGVDKKNITLEEIEIVRQRMIAKRTLKQLKEWRKEHESDRDVISGEQRKDETVNEVN